jgi:hypothetical protein
VHVVLAYRVPAVVTVAADSFAELGAHESQCILDVIAVPVESSRAEAVLGGSEYSFKSHRPPEAPLQKPQVSVPIFVPLPDDQRVEGVEGVGQVEGVGRVGGVKWD